MKVQFIVGDDDGKNLEWRDLYFDEKQFIGFSMPDEKDELGAGVTVYTRCGTFTLKQEKHLIDYLSDKFIVGN